MIVSNLEVLPGQRVVKHLGLAQGSTVRAKHAGKDFLSGLKNIVGGELKAYTELMQEARDEALQRMTEEARSMGANAVLNVRFTTTSITMGAAEILAYGSAVQLEAI
ncbi:MAG: YbjQ family protein [Burkholderiales bacterium]|nr:YbjQ family protein [Burkholderiales bacterium]MBH2016903.1 YbjQ family protein [Burkholderiales bacterium]